MQTPQDTQTPVTAGSAVEPVESLDLAAPPAPDRVPWLVAIGVVVAWVVMLTALFDAAPPPDPAAPIDVLNEVLGLAFWMGLLAGAAGLAMRLRWGLAVSAGAAALLGIGAVTCYFDGHTGAWLAIQAGTAAGIGGVSAALYKFSPVVDDR